MSAPRKNGAMNPPALPPTPEPAAPAAAPLPPPTPPLPPPSPALPPAWPPPPTVPALPPVTTPPELEPPVPPVFIPPAPAGEAPPTALPPVPPSIAPPTELPPLGIPPLPEDPGGCSLEHANAKTQAATALGATTLRMTIRGTVVILVEWFRDARTLEIKSSMAPTASIGRTNSSSPYDRSTNHEPDPRR